jgi:4-azaleucine resistance transporter AzlC
MRAALKATAPIAAGYLSLGAAYGVFFAGQGLPSSYAVLMSVFTYAGSLQFASAAFFKGMPILEIFLLSAALSVRHVFYGASMAQAYKGLPFKAYLAFGLTDETFAVLSSPYPEEADPKAYPFFVTLLSHLYWIGGTCAGLFLSGMAHFSTAGVEFAMAALFLTLFASQWMAKANRAYSAFGLAASALALLAPWDWFLPAALAILAAGALLPPVRRKGGRGA